MSLGLALAGGGLKGIAHIGAIQALRDLGIEIDYLSGTSSGSIIAAFFAMGYTLEETKEATNEYYRELTKINKTPIAKAGFTYLTSGTAKISGLVPGEKIENLVNSFAEKKGIKNIKDIKIPFAIATVDTITTKECIFLSKEYDLENEDIDYIYNVPIGKAIRASMSFPGIFTPCEFGNYNFIDGGTKDNLPVHVLKDMGATKVLALSFKLDEYVPKEDIFGVLLRAVDIFSLKDVRKAQKEADLAIEIEAEGTRLLEISDMQKCVEIGYNTIMDNKEKIFELIKE